MNEITETLKDLFKKPQEFSPKENGELPVDIVYRFLSEWIEITAADGFEFPDRDKYRVTEKVLFDTFLTWARENKENPFSVESFNYCVRRLLLHVKFIPGWVGGDMNGEKNYIWVGIRLKAVDF